MTKKELPKVYDPQAVESSIYQMWMDGKCFHSEPNKDKKPFTIVMPPPNVTGQLHMGHALDCTLQDILIRYKRMQGYNALWVPGCDHAGIATQIKVEEDLRVNEGKTRYDLGRQKFLERVWQWKEKYGDRIVSQQKKMGVSCDWDRARFTMDEGCSKAVREVFVSLYEKDLIYKGSRIINWCPHCVTALSDAEVEYTEKPGHLWHMRYPIKGTDRYLVVATTRPETMMGDTGVAVNPNDERYRDLVGKTCILPIMNREIPIVADEYVDMTFGTGCVKMTPAHDPNDFEVGLRHNLETIRVIDDNGKINENGGPYNGMDRYECRKKVIEDLQEAGFIEKIEDYSHNVGTCYRCHNDVEPLISAQWFVRMEPLAKEALRVVNDGEVKFVPDRFSKIYTNWMENVHDWCISRQLWWGHQMPIWYGPDGEIFCEENVEEAQAAADKHYGKHVELTRETDVLDTWFSSGLWAFSTLGWPDKSDYLDTFYPTSVLVTGFDIIFFWVARMMMMSMYMMKKVPFRKCYIHGLVRDEKGQKMSKSKGNTIDPMILVEQYGADALRFFMAAMETQGRDINMSEARIAGYRNFATKLWNAARFGEMNECRLRSDFDETKAELAVNRWIIAKAKQATKEVTDNLNAFRFSEAANAVYQFTWGSFCDWYIEMIKPILYGEDEKAKAETRAAFAWVLDRILVILHPFMPFITTELWNNTCDERKCKLINFAWPKDAAFDTAAMDEVDWSIELISAIRSLRAEMNIPAGAKLTVYLKDGNAQSCANLQSFNQIICSLARLDKLECFASGQEISKDMVSGVFREGIILLPLKGVVDFAAEKERLKKELDNLNKYLEGYARKLSNPSFVERAPAKVVEEEKRRQAEAMENKAKIEEALQRIANF